MEDRSAIVPGHRDDNPVSTSDVLRSNSHGQPRANADWNRMSVSWDSTVSQNQVMRLFPVQNEEHWAER
jgi:hypothetical protein